jgi:FMN-dependent NADH-azoreductase
MVQYTGVNELVITISADTTGQTDMQILQLNTSARSTGANSTTVANLITERLKNRHPQATVRLRDMAVEPHPILDEPALTAMFTPAEQRSTEQAARMAHDDTLIEEIKASDIIVLGVPMYNFGIPVQLKAWFDAIAKAGVTFRYTEKGPEGLLTGKKVYVALARGGIYRDTPNDTQVPYLKLMLGFLGMTDVHYIYAEGFAMGPDAATNAMQEAHQQIDDLFA